MLAAFVSLRVFTLRIWGNRRDSEEYIGYITKASHRAPHLESFTIDHSGYIFRCKRVDENWVV